MDATHLHLILNHVPVVGLGVVILCLIAAAYWRSSDLSKFGLALAILIALIAIPVFLTGEPAEESIEHLAGVSHSIIEAHEESAEVAFGAVLTVGASALAVLLLSWRRPPLLAKAGKIVLAVCVIAAGLMSRAAYLGGRIRHSEIRATASAGSANGEEFARNSEQESNDKDKQQD